MSWFWFCVLDGCRDPAGQDINFCWLVVDESSVQRERCVREQCVGWMLSSSEDTFGMILIRS